MRIKKTLFISFLLLSNLLLAQKKNITINPYPINGVSSIEIVVKEKGIYVLKIFDAQNTILHERKMDIERKKDFKHDFSNYKKGKYTFAIYRNKKKVFVRFFDKR